MAVSREINYAIVILTPSVTNTVVSGNIVLHNVDNRILDCGTDTVLKNNRIIPFPN